MNRLSVIFDRLDATALNSRIKSWSFDQCRGSLHNSEWAARSKDRNCIPQTHFLLNLDHFSVGCISLFYCQWNGLESLHRLNEFVYATSAKLGGAILASHILRDLKNSSTSTASYWIWGYWAKNALNVDQNVCVVHIVSVSIHLRSLRRICADQWYPVVIPLNRMYQLCIMPREVFFVQYLSLKDSGACKKQIKQKNISFEKLWATQHMALHASLSWVCSFTHEHLYGKWTSTFHCCRNVLPGGVNQPPPRKNPTYRVYIETSSLIRVRWYEAPIKKGWQILAYWFWEVVEESLCCSSYVRSYE